MVASLLLTDPQSLPQRWELKLCCAPVYWNPASGTRALRSTLRKQIAWNACLPRHMMCRRRKQSDKCLWIRPSRCPSFKYWSWNRSNITTLLYKRWIRSNKTKKQHRIKTWAVTWCTSMTTVKAVDNAHQDEHKTSSAPWMDKQSRRRISRPKLYPLLVFQESEVL